MEEKGYSQFLILKETFYQTNLPQNNGSFVDFFPHWVTLSTLILGSCCCYKVENRWHQGVLQARCFADQDILRKKWNCTYDVATRCSSKLSIWNQCPSHRFGRKSKYGGGDMYWVEVAIKGNERPDSWTIFKLTVLSIVLNLFEIFNPTGISAAISSRRSCSGTRRRRTRMTLGHWAHRWPIPLRLCATCFKVWHMSFHDSVWKRIWKDDSLFFPTLKPYCNTPYSPQ